MSKFFKGLMASALVLSLMAPIAIGREVPQPGPGPVQNTYSVGNIIKNSWFGKLGLAAIIFAVGEAAFIAWDQLASTK